MLCSRKKLQIHRLTVGGWGGYKENEITVSVSFLKEKPCEFPPYFQEVYKAVIDRNHYTVLKMFSFCRFKKRFIFCLCVCVHVPV